MCTVRRCIYRCVFYTSCKGLKVSTFIYRPVKACPHWRLQSPISATICRQKQRLSQKTATDAEKCDCRRIQRLSPLSRRFRRQSPFSATVALFCDSRHFRWQCGQGFTGKSWPAAVYNSKCEFRSSDSTYHQNLFLRPVAILFYFAHIKPRWKMQNSGANIFNENVKCRRVWKGLYFLSVCSSCVAC